MLNHPILSVLLTCFVKLTKLYLRYIICYKEYGFDFTEQNKMQGEIKKMNIFCFFAVSKED
jgi:hypothetical protein